jgi:hypothetical protein
MALLSANADTNPTAAMNPAASWATAKASGTIVSVSMARLAPAAIAVVNATISSENPPNTV